MLTRTQKIKWETRPAQKSITQMLDEQFSIQELRISKEFQKKKIKYFYASLGRGLMKNFLFKNGGFQKNLKKRSNLFMPHWNRFSSNYIV